MRSAETGARVAEKGISVSPIPSPQTFPTFRQLRRNEISIDTGQLNPPRTNEPMCRASRRSPGTGHIQRCARGRDVHARRCRDIKRDSLFCRTRVEQGVYRLARGRGGRIRYPGFNDRVHHGIALQVEITVQARIPDLRRQFGEVLRVYLTPSEIKEALDFLRDPLSARLRDPAFVQSLETGDPNGTDLPSQMGAKMTPQQRELATRFLQSSSGKKLVELTP